MVERSFAGFIGNEVLLADRARLEFGFRADYFDFDAHDRLPPQGSDPHFTAVRIAERTSDSLLSPKADLVLTPWTDTDLYLDFGEGYHSNDARNALLGQGTDFSPLVKSLGYEFGARTRRLDGRLESAASVWLLDLDSELVFSGDVGNQETGAGGNFIPSGPTRRWGVDFETRYQLTRWLVADYDLAWADPRYMNGEAIPLAPTLLDLIARYRWRNVELSLQALNLTNTDWREAQFSDNSCVRREVGRTPGCPVDPGQQGAHAGPPAALHYTPGDPFGAYGGVMLYF